MMRYNVKKIFGFFRLRYIYIYFFLYSILDYYFNGKLRQAGIFDTLKSYMGITGIPFLFAVTVSMTISPHLKDRTKKMLLSVRLHCFFILSVCCIYMFFMHKLQLPFEKEMADSSVIEKFLQLGIYKYKIGFISAYLFYLILTNVMYIYIYIALSVLMFCTTFLITVRPIKMTITRIYHNYKEKKRIEYEEQLLREQIAIKEALEKREILMREKMEQEKENRIKERVEEVISKKKLVLESRSIDEKNNEVDKKNEVTEEEFMKIIDPDFSKDDREKIKEIPEAKIEESTEKKLVEEVKTESMPSDMAFESPTEFKIFTVGSSEKEEKEVKTEVKKERKLLTIKQIKEVKKEKDDIGI